ncbi:extensin family protein [Intrasporangium sp.]|uniref:extensin family protein n=1 Tax=Intrasporangium sp. TaxID=1925024 RepID=UPI00293A705C|nr:extensin family protein [Intrasporangium sp.]MDV3221088.1 extensin family protein [Intrasporangium sp.]
MSETRERRSGPAPSGPGGRPAPGEPPLRLTRRGFLVLGALGVGTVAAGAYAVTQGVPGLPEIPGLAGPSPREVFVDPVPVDHTALQARTRLGGAAYVYEISGKPATYYVEPAFGARLDSWLALHRRHTGQSPDAIRSYGAWARGRPNSWHSSGQAFDLARLRADGKDLVSLRYDLWRDSPAPELRRRLSAYWRVAAGLHHEFADVLTYLYDDAHANHIHVDTGRFGDERPRLIRRSRVQAQAVQAMCRHVWGRTDVEVTGEWDDATRGATTEILESIDGPGELEESREAWQAFMVATMAHA